MTTEQESPRWHAALAYALVGPPVRDLPEPGTPKVAQLIASLGGAAPLRAEVVKARAAGSWPVSVPAELRRGLGAAQFAAAWTALLNELGPTTNARPVVSDRALTNDERRLLADRPPHHGG